MSTLEAGFSLPADISFPDSPDSEPATCSSVGSSSQSEKGATSSTHLGSTGGGVGGGLGSPEDEEKRNIIMVSRQDSTTQCNYLWMGP